MHLNLPRYDSATVAATLTKALEELLTLPPTASPEHLRLDQLVHDIAALVERTDPETAEALSDTLDAALKEARDAVEAAAPRPDDFPPEVAEAVEGEAQAGEPDMRAAGLVGDAFLALAMRDAGLLTPYSPDSAGGYPGPGKTRDGGL